jgi:hypothetical protein
VGRKLIFSAKLPVDARYFARGGVGDVELDAIDQELQSPSRNYLRILQIT